MGGLESAARLTLALAVVGTLPLAIVYGGCGWQVSAEPDAGDGGSGMAMPDAGGGLGMAMPDAVGDGLGMTMPDAGGGGLGMAQPDAGDSGFRVTTGCCYGTGFLQCSSDGRQLMNCVIDTTGGCLNSYAQRGNVWSVLDCPKGCAPDAPDAAAHCVP